MNTSTTPRFNNDYDSFSSIEKTEIRKLKKKISSYPVPPTNDEDWKQLHQFDSDYPQGIVCAARINFADRLVYELNATTGDITFTNCRSHRYRGKTYSEVEDSMRRTFGELRKSCVTKSHKLAFNHLLNSFKFK